MLYRIKDQKILLAAKTKKVLYTAFIGKESHNGKGFSKGKEKKEDSIGNG